MSSTSLILPDRIVQSYRVVSTKEAFFVLVIESCPLGIRWQGRIHYTITLVTCVDDELPFIFHSLPSLSSFIGAVINIRFAEYPMRLRQLFCNDCSRRKYVLCVNIEIEMVTFSSLCFPRVFFARVLHRINREFLLYDRAVSAFNWKG